MKEAKIRLILSDRLVEVYRLCKQINEDFDKECIHKFRLSVKTFRALIHLLAFQDKKSKLKLPETIRRLYEISGVVREAQIESEIIKTPGSEIPGYQDHLDLVLIEQKSKWAEHYKIKSNRGIDKFLNRVSIKDLTTDDVLDFFVSRKATINQIIKSQKISNDHIHEVRKQLKDMIYLTGILKKYWKSGLKKVKKSPSDAIKNLTTEIGEFNDQRILLEHIVSHYFEQNPSIKKVIKPVMNAMGLKQVEQKKIMTASLRQFVVLLAN